VNNSELYLSNLSLGANIIYATYGGFVEFISGVLKVIDSQAGYGLVASTAGKAIGALSDFDNCYIGVYATGGSVAGGVSSLTNCNTDYSPAQGTMGNNGAITF
jgi:hypothetical protein